MHAQNETYIAHVRRVESAHQLAFDGLDHLSVASNGEGIVHMNGEDDHRVVVVIL